MMKQFMDDDFLLQTEVARQLYHQCAAALPIIDYHCHVSAKEIYEDKRFNHLTEAWLGGRQPDGSFQGDHYKWRLMRQYGIDESFVTGDRPPFERFAQFTRALEIAIGNPIHHWCNLELKNYFGIHEELTSDTVKSVWEQTAQQLRQGEGFSVRNLILNSRVEYIGTTDDPIDSLEYHIRLKEDKLFPCRVAPSFRPDRALQILKDDFCEYMVKLGECVGQKELFTVDDVCSALTKRLDFFVENGCRISDHGLETIPFRIPSANEVQNIYRKRMNGESISSQDAQAYQTYLLLFLGRAYHQRHVVMQLHFNCVRNVNARQFTAMGPDCGFDIMGKTSCIGELAQLLSDLDSTKECPKMILYSLDPSDYGQLSTLAGSFHETNMRGKIQHGSAWWFNDTKSGIETHLQSLASLGLLSNNIGMLTDSRSFLSYVRHEYFRRILCNFLGNLVSSGQFPPDWNRLYSITENICYRNAKSFFDL